MSLLERIKATIFGEVPPPPPRTVGEDNDDAWSRVRQADQIPVSDVSTPADDPALDDVAAAGVQPLSKPVEIEETQNPQRRPNARLN
jgi:hypothetical protein